MGRNCFNCPKWCKHNKLIEENNLIYFGKKVYRCDYCKRSKDNFFEKRSLKDHIIHVHINKRSYKCLNCNLTFNRRIQLNEHRNTCRKSFKCSNCTESFVSNDKLKIHLKTHNSKHEHYKSNQNLERISNKNSFPVKSYECDYCKKNFTNKCLLKIHISLHTKKETAEETYKCPKCDKKFMKKDIMNLHLKNHGAQETYERHLSDKSFKNSNGFRKNKKKSNVLECDYCSKTFEKKDHLKNHIRVHTGEKSFKCKVCNKAFNTESSFIQHQKNTNHVTKPFRCGDCKIVKKSKDLSKQNSNHNKNKTNESLNKSSNKTSKANELVIIHDSNSDSENSIQELSKIEIEKSIIKQDLIKINDSDGSIEITDDDDDDDDCDVKPTNKLVPNPFNKRNDIENSSGNHIENRSGRQSTSGWFSRLKDFITGSH